MAKGYQRDTGGFLAQCLFAVCLGGLAGVLWACQHRIKALFSHSTPLVQTPAAQEVEGTSKKRDEAKSK